MGNSWCIVFSCAIIKTFCQKIHMKLVAKKASNPSGLLAQY